jgi:hypothetical protein
MREAKTIVRTGQDKVLVRPHIPSLRWSRFEISTLNILAVKGSIISRPLFLYVSYPA